MANVVPHAYLADPGISVTQENRPGGDPAAVINLSLNESLYGASPAAVAAIQGRAGTANIYPQPPSTDLRMGLSRLHGIDPDELVCGNGSEEVLDTLARCYVRPGDEVIYTEYAYMGFPLITRRLGATAVPVKEKADFLCDVDAILAAITPKTKLIFFANPNNPTGNYIPASEVKRLRDGVRPDIVLCIDSAYAEFVTGPNYTAGHELVAGTENVFVTRTFSKCYGLAACRVGWGHGPKSMIRVMNRMRAIGNVNAFAQAAALAALADQDFVKSVRERNHAVREKATKSFQGLGLYVVPSQCNFLAVQFPAAAGRSALDVQRAVLAEGLILRRMDDYGLPDYIRITLPTEKDLDRLLGAVHRAFGRNAA